MISKEKDIIGKQIRNMISFMLFMSILLTLTIKVQGYELAIEDIVLGYVDDLDDKNEILQKVCMNYINELNVRPENVVKITVNSNIKATPTSINISKLNGNGEVAENLYDAVVINENLLNLQLEVINNVEEVVEAPCIEEYSDELYMGQQCIEEGESGKKIVYKKEHYEGVDKISEEVINEVVQIEPVPTIIKNGVKNPYYDGVKFLSNPLIGATITSDFGESRTSSFHKGIDLAKSIGENISAGFNGEVIFAGYNNGGYGNLVIIKHDNDIETYYAHLNEIKVNEGEKVNSGDIIGTVGNTGYSTGPHLHFELRVGETPVNPVNYIIGL